MSKKQPTSTNQKVAQGGLRGHRYFIIAGEASGDLHASNLMRELKTLDAKAEFCFLGGDLMAAQGGEMVKHYRDMAFMGFIAVLKNARTVLNNLADAKQAIARFRPDVVILVDYPSFNLRIARFVKETLHLPVYYYISPKIWAWKEFRIKSIKKYVDRMFTILPFETEFYQNHDYEVTYAGNPSVDSIASRPHQQQTFSEFCRINKLTELPIIAILPGSRKQEIAGCLPAMLEAAKKFSNHQIVVSGAPGMEPDFYKSFIKNSETNVVFNQTYELVAHAHAAVVNSGTATLETALLNTPQVVVYKVALAPLAMPLKKILIQVKYVSLVNIIAGKEVVKELVGDLFTVTNIRNELNKLLHDEKYRLEMLDGYHEIREKLGAPGAAVNAAR